MKRWQDYIFEPVRLEPAPIILLGIIATLLLVTAAEIIYGSPMSGLYPWVNPLLLSGSVLGLAAMVLSTYGSSKVARLVVVALALLSIVIVVRAFQYAFDHEDNWWPKDIKRVNSQKVGERTLALRSPLFCVPLRALRLGI